MKNLFFTICFLASFLGSADAATRWVDSSLASNCTANYSIASRNCTGSDGDAYTNANRNTAIAATQQGDILEWRAGTYSGNWDSTPIKFNQGTSYANAPIFQCRATETCTLTGTMAFRATAFYLIFKRFTIVASVNSEAVVVFKSGAHHVRFEDMDVTNTNATAPVIIAPKFDSTDLEFIGGRYHNGYYCFYLSGDRILIEGITCDNTTNYGIHIHSSVAGGKPDDNIVRFNTIHTTATVNTNQAGIVLSTGTGNKAYGNVVRDGSGRGIQVSGATVNPVVYNNTIVQNAAFGIRVEAGVTGAIIKNNIVLNTEISDVGTGTTFGNNICQNAGTGCASTSTEAALFTDPANNDFTLKTGSPAIDAGADLGASFNTDFAGISRPQGSAWDVGAYELVQETEPPIVWNVTVNSSPNSGVAITVSPADNGALTDGSTSFVRNYNDTTAVTLIAPATAAGDAFVSWTGCDSVGGTGNRTCTVTMTTDRTVQANYDTPVILKPPTNLKIGSGVTWRIGRR